MLRTQSSDVAIIGGGLFGLSGKFELAQLLGSITKIDAHKIHQLQNITVAEWLEQTIRHPQVRALVQTLFRLATYSNDPHHQSAGAALAQLQPPTRHRVTPCPGPSPAPPQHPALAPPRPSSPSPLQHLHPHAAHPA